MKHDVLWCKISFAIRILLLFFSSHSRPKNLYEAIAYQDSYEGNVADISHITMHIETINGA